MNPKVSVIVPVYNVEKYLNKALNSLKNQTLKELEIICINDGSIDRSLDILKNFAAMDSRFHIINQSNKGTGAARNIGLKHAQGEYIAFLDPDDWFQEDSMELLYNQAKKQNCDMVTFGYNTVDENSGNVIQKVDLKENLRGVYELDTGKTFNWKDIKPKVFGGLFYASWNKFYSSDFLKRNKLHFTDCSMSEDNAFVFDSTLRAKSIGYNSDVYYNYLKRTSSAVHKVSDRNFCIFKVCDAVKKAVNTSGLQGELSKELDDYIIDTIWYHFKRVKSRVQYANKCMQQFSGEQLRGIMQKLEEQNRVFAGIQEIISALKKNK